MYTNSILLTNKRMDGLEKHPLLPIIYKASNFFKK